MPMPPRPPRGTTALPPIGLRRPRLRLSTVALGAAFLCAGPASAFEIDTGHPELTLRLDTTVRGNLGMRMEKQDSRILNNPNYDESDGKFGRGDFVTQRLDLLEELDLQYQKKVGLRISAAAWYDHAYGDKTVTTRVPGYASSYTGSQYNSTVERYTNGPSGEILDAFAWANFRIADKPANIKLGRLTNYWGEALLMGAHAISYSQSPVDGVKAVTSPGIELKEVFLPLGQAYLKYQPSPSVSLAAQYFLEWKPSRLPYGGTYFGVADPFFEGPDRLPVDAAGNSLAHATSVKPGKTGNWGLSAKFEVEPIESTVGVYYRRFNDYNPWFAPNFTGFVAIPGVGVVPTAWQLVYPKSVSIVGASLSRSLGPVSFSTELSLRRNGALNAADSGLNPADGQGPRGDTWHLLANGIYLLPQTPLFDTGNLIVEAAYSRLKSIKSNAAFYKAQGYASCVSPFGTAGDKSDGCSTQDYLGLAVLFAPQYTQVAPSWDLELPMSLNVGLKGNAPSSGGGNEGSVSWSVGAKLTYASRHEFQLLYADSRARSKYDPSGSVLIGGSGSTGTNDRAWLAFTYKTGF